MNLAFIHTAGGLLLEFVDQRQRGHRAVSNRLERWCWLFAHNANRGVHTVISMQTYTDMACIHYEQGEQAHTHELTCVDAQRHRLTCKQEKHAVNSMHANVRYRRVSCKKGTVIHTNTRAHNIFTLRANSCLIRAVSVLTSDGICALCLCTLPESQKMNRGTPQSPQAGWKRVLTVTEKPQMVASHYYGIRCTELDLELAEGNKSTGYTYGACAIHTVHVQCMHSMSKPQYRLGVLQGLTTECYFKLIYSVLSSFKVDDWNVYWSIHFKFNKYCKSFPLASALHLKSHSSIYSACNNWSIFLKIVHFKHFVPEQNKKIVALKWLRVPCFCFCLFVCFLLQWMELYIFVPESHSQDNKLYKVVCKHNLFSLLLEMQQDPGLLS